MPAVPAAVGPMGSDAIFTVTLTIAGKKVGSFQECSGMGMRVRTREVREGGLNDGVVVLPDGVEYDNLVLKRGVTKVGSLLAWVTACQTKGFRASAQEVSVITHGPDGKPLAHWVFSGAWPVRWTGPALDAAGSAVATESLEIAFTRITAKPA